MNGSNGPNESRSSRPDHRPADDANRPVKRERPESALRLGNGSQVPRRPMHLVFFNTVPCVGPCPRWTGYVSPGKPLLIVACRPRACGTIAGWPDAACPVAACRRHTAALPTAALAASALAASAVFTSATRASVVSSTRSTSAAASTTSTAIAAASSLPLFFSRRCRASLRMSSSMCASWSWMCAPAGLMQLDCDRLSRTGRML